jgi:hypothetical protein
MDGGSIDTPLDCLAAAVLELDPAFIKAVEHSDAWHGVMHAL